MIGETLGSYTILNRIGAGGMGEVFLGQHTRIDRQAAIKVLLPELSSNKEMVDRFFAEARATSSIRHPGIVEVSDCNVLANGRAYIVMEMLLGETLASRLARQPALGGDGACALAIAGEIASAVGAAHAKGIVHRDLKPDNIFLVTDAGRPHGCQVKVLDFGIAKLVGRDRDGERPASRTRTGTLMGTPVYMSPEQCRGARQVDHRTDIYSLGCILFEMLAGRPPFTYEGYGELISAHMNEAPPSLASLGGGGDPGADELIGRMLAKAQDARPQTMAEVHAAIRDLETVGEIQGIAIPIRSAAVPPTAHPPTGPRPGGGGTSILPTPARLGTAVLSTGSSKTTTLSGQAAEDIGVRRPRRAVMGAVAGLGAAAVIGGVLFIRRPPATPDVASLAPPAVAVAPEQAVAAPPAPATVIIEVSDAPEDLVLTVDGKAARLPLTLPQSTDLHTLVFTARGFRGRTLKVDASTNRMLTLSLQPEVAPVPRAREQTNLSEPTRKKPHPHPPPSRRNDARKL